jgi:hypothetical protein
MPTLWPAGPWRFEAAVTMTECNEQSVTNWLQLAQIANYFTAPAVLPMLARRTLIIQFCASPLWAGPKLIQRRTAQQTPR